MQTITVPYKASQEHALKIRTWKRINALMVRTGYAQGENRSAAEIEKVIKERFPSQPLGSWAAHCAAYEAKTLRNKVPDGRMIFGGRDQLLRRQKGLISNAEWRERRHSRSLQIIGDRTRWGNRHFRLSDEGRKCTVTFMKDSVALDLPQMTGKQGRLLKAICALADACEISVQFSLNTKTLSVTFDEMDLRRLAPGQTLEQVKIAEQGKSRRGRKRKDAGTHYAAKRVKPIDPADRPVHPEWRDRIPSKSNRVIGIDLNPAWIGVSVIDISGNPASVDSVKILDHRLHKIDVPFSAAYENMTSIMSNVARTIINLARAWNCGLIVHENGLGKLAWSKKKKKTQTINYWSRNIIISSLQRRCKLAGIQLLPTWASYSTTIGNICFNLPDACASAVEIARRGYASTCNIKDRLPAVPPMVHTRRWKDEDVPNDIAKTLSDADSWAQVHRAIKPAQTRHPAFGGPLVLSKGSARGQSAKPIDALAIGYRRLHPGKLDPGSEVFFGEQRYAVDRLGNGKGVSCSARPVLTSMVRNSSDQV